MRLIVDSLIVIEWLSMRSHVEFLERVRFDLYAGGVALELL